MKNVSIDRLAPASARPLALLSALIAAALGAGCTTGPLYQVPSTPDVTAFKEAAGWSPAAPADALARGPWWSLFDDPVLDALERRVEVSNLTVAEAAAAYDQARALLREQRAALFPTLSLSGGGTRDGGGSGGSSASTGTGTGSSSSGGAANRYQVAIGGSWEPDVWGRLRGGVSAAGASAQASAADLAGATLSAQGELAAAYFGARQADAQQALLDATITGYRRALQITQNRYDAGVVARTDVLQAQTQLASAQADRVDLDRQRAQYEHAIAVLVGEAPANFTLTPLAAPQPPTVFNAAAAAAPAATSTSAPTTAATVANGAASASVSVSVSVPASALGAAPPAVPVSLPSTLLQRRPDIAAAERRVAAANAQIGIARSAYFPSFGLSASYGFGASRVADLFNASAAVWSFGLQAAQTLFDAGATGARVDAARAAHAATVARYRQTVLTAFQDVEDQLAATRVLEQQYVLRQQASAAADQVEAQVINRYRAGQVGFTDVVTAQVTALNARRSLVTLAGSRQTTAVALIQALGGGWAATGLQTQE